MKRASELRRLARKHPEMWIRVRLSQAKKRALDAGLEFDILPEDIELPTHCPVFGVELVYSDAARGPNRASIDRIDSRRGYVKRNVWVISMRANAIKSDASLEELEQLARVLWFLEAA